MELSRELLRKYLEYNPETGVFTRKINSGKCKKGDVVGSLSKGYLYVKIDNKSYALHRLAVFLTTGIFPVTDVDHINGIKSDNRIANLRVCSRSDNAKNAKLNRNNRLMVKGVRKLKDTGKYQVRLNQKSFGCYEDLELAELVAIEAREKYHGEFARHA